MNIDRSNLIRVRLFWIASLAIAFLCCHDVNAQDDGLSSANSSSRQWPRLFKKPANSGLDNLKPISLPKLGLFRNIESNEIDDPPAKKHYGFPRMRSEKAPDRPGFFRGINQRSKEFFDRTSTGFTDWASRTNDQARNRTAETWGSISRGMKKPVGDFSQKKPSSNQPPVRSARIIESEPKVKF